MTLARTVAVTYGPHGRTCILDRLAGMLATKDGVTVAREIELGDSLENLGAETLKAACIKVNDDVGDGTTTAAILAAAILEGGWKAIVAGAQPKEIARGIMAAGDEVVAYVQEQAHPVKNQQGLEKIALIASNGDQEVASFLAEACMAVGRDGAIVIEDGRGVDSTLTFKEGMEINQGALSPAFLVGCGMERIIEGPLVAVVSNVLSKMDDVRELMEVASQWPQNELIVFAPDVVGEALATMALNNSKEIVKCIAVRAPGGGGRREDYLKDIAALAGADYVDPVAGYDVKAWDPEWFGSFRQATIGMKSTVLKAYEESSGGIEQRLAEIRGEEDRCTSDYDRDRLRERKAKLTGGLAILEIGGVTEGAMKERRARVEDALSAVQAALKGGTVPGGGIAYIMGIETLDGTRVDETDDFVTGWAVCRNALARPTEVLAHNAGKNGKAVVERVRQIRTSTGHRIHTGRHDLGDYGWDAMRDEVRDLTQDPAIIDPALVAASVVETACSVAATLLTTGASIVSAKKEES